MNLEVRWIEDILSLEREKSISKAAEKRFVSQSAFTRRIQHIEHLLGVEIIERNNHKQIEFTEIGRLLLSMSKKVDKQISETIQLIQNLKVEQEHTLRIGVAHSLASSFLLNFLQRLPQIKDAKIEIIAVNIGEGLSLLKQASCNFMVCYADNKSNGLIKEDILSSIKIADTQIVPVILSTALTQADIELTTHFPLLAYSKNAYLRKLVDRRIAQQLDYKILYETDNANDLKDMVLKGLGVAWLPLLTIEQEVASGVLTILGDGQFTLTQEIDIYRNRFDDNPLVDAIWHFLKTQHLNR